MNKVEFAVCRIKEKLPGNQGFATKGSGCVVHSESLTSSWGWKCHYFIVTPSVVLCREDLASNKVFLAEFLSKDKRGLETFEIKQMAEVCKDVVGRRLDSADLDLYLTFLSVEPLDKRGFLKRMVKKGSLQTYRPLESLESENKTTEELTEGLFCHVIVDLFSDQESTNSPFATQTYKLVYDFQTREFSLQDFGGTLIHFNNEIPPIGAVVFTKKGEFAGLLRNFSSDWVTAIFLPQPFKEEDGERDVTALSTRDETSVEINGDVTSEITLKQEIQLESHSTKLVDDTPHAEGYFEDVFPQKNNNVSRPTDNDVERGNNNYPNSRDVIQNGGDDRAGRQDNSGVLVFKQFQECPENLIPGNRTENVETEMLLLSTDNTAEVKEYEEKGGSGFFDETVNNNYSDAVKDIQKKAGDSGEKQVSCDGAGKATVETTVQEEGQVLVCKTAEGDDTIKSASDVPERFSDVEVDPYMEEEPLGHLDKQETSVLVHDGDPCSLENGSSAVEELPEESHRAVKAADCEASLSDSTETATHGGGVEVADESTSRESITGHDSSLITVVQVDGTFLPVETNKSKEQGELDDSETIVSEKVPLESKGVSTTEQPGISGEQSTSCFSDEDDGQITDLKKDTCIPAVNPGVIFEDNQVSANTKTEGASETYSAQMPGIAVEASDIDNLVGTKPEDSCETDSTQMPGNIVDIEPDDVYNLISAKPEDATETDSSQMPCSTGDIEAGDIDNLVAAKPEDARETDPTQMPGSSTVDIEAGDIDNLVGAKPEDTSETDPTQMPAGSIVDIEAGDVDNLVGAKPEDARETDPTQMPGSSAVDIEAGDIDNLVCAKPEDASETDPTQMPAGSIVDIETGDVDNLVGAKPEDTRETDPTQMPAGSIVDIKAGDIDNLVSAKPGDSNIMDIGSGDVDNLVIAKPEDASETDSTQMPGSTNIAMCIETSEQVSGGLELVTQGNQEFTRISEVTVNTSHDSLDVSVCNTSAIEDITEIGLKDDSNLKEDSCSRESVLENTNGKGSLIDTSQILEKNGSGQPLHENEFEEIADTDDHNLKGDNQGCDDVVTNLHEKDNSIDISQTAESNSFGELNGQLGEPCVVENDVRTHEDWIDSEGENNVENVSGETKNVSEQSELASIMEQCSQKLNSIQTREDNEKVLMHEEVNNKVTEHESDITETTGVSEEYADKERISFKKTSTEYNDNHADKEFLEDSSPSEDTVAVQRVDADALLSETITNSPHILRDLGSCLDTEYQYGKVPCWRDLAELLAISPEDYEDCTTFSLTSPTEDLFVFLSATKPQLTIQEIKEALKEIDRLDVVHLLDRKIAGGLIREESILGNLVERDGTGILGRMAMKLDRTKTNNWKDLALQLCVPPRVLRNFGSHQGHNPALMLFKYIPIFDPDVTLDHLKGCLTSIERQDAVAVLEKASIPGDEPVKDILDDSDLLDRITDMLNDDSTHHWRHLARALKIPPEKCKIFEPTEENNSATKLLFKSIEKCEPDLTFEELVLALVAMKRQDVLDVLQKYFSSDDIDQILEENNLLTPAEDPLVDQKEI